MIIIEKNVGEKIPYSVNTRTTNITFDDDLSIKLSKREQDWPVHIDICSDSDDCLVIGAAVGRRYVAQIDIPARAYETIIVEEDGQMVEHEQPVALDLDTVTLSLFAIDE